MQALTAEGLIAHIEYKARAYELPRETADAMLAALAAGAEPDYQALYREVTQRPLPSKAYHTAPTEFRYLIGNLGLRRARPEDGYWNINAAGQPEGVYVAAEPDIRGRWAATDEWDIWEVHTEGLTWAHDLLNPGCWAILENIRPARLVLKHEGLTSRA